MKLETETGSSTSAGDPWRASMWQETKSTHINMTVETLASPSWS